MTGIATPDPNPFEDCWIFAYYPTNGGRISDKDDKILRNIGKVYEAKDVGSGTLLVPPFERDMQWRIKRANVDKMAATLRKAGYRVEIRDIPPRARGENA